MPRPKVQASIRENLSGQAYLAIRNKILHGQLTLGAVLSRRKLATDLGMSMLPICTAIQHLEDEGLLESKPRVGTRVRIPTEQDIRERHIIREALESQAARLVAENATMQQRQELVHMAEQLDALYRRASTDQDPEFLFAVHGYHMQFHLRIAEFSGVVALRELIEKNSVLVLNWLYDLVTPQTPLPLRFHSDLIDVVTGRDVDAAEQAMRKHVQYGEEETVRAVVRASTSPESRWRLRGSPVEESNPVQVGTTALG
jgi:GntR family transcriptional regulator, rspAB operon transcriptional repressor